MTKSDEFQLAGPTPNPWFATLPRYEPGRPLEEVARELGVDGIDEIVKLASNENALGPSPKAVAAMQAVAGRMHLYPDGDAFYLREALAQKLDIPATHILPGNGSNELIELLGHVFLDQDSEIVMSQYAFVIYKLVALLFNARTITVPASGFGHDLEAMRAAITPRTKLVFIANPNNPTGTQVDAGALDRFVADIPEHVCVVLDEAYVDLLLPGQQPASVSYVRAGRPVCILRTFSKGYGLAGLRVGYAIGQPEFLHWLNRARQPFNVNYMAQTAAIAALADDAHLAASRQMVRSGLAQLTAGLEKLGMAYVPSVANFLLVKVGAGREVFAALQQQQVIVRPLDGYGLPEYVRVTVGRAEENVKFLKALAAVMAERRDLEPA